VCALQISAVPNPERPSHLLALEVRAIEERGRLAEDGRLRVGDQIVEINGTPCEQVGSSNCFQLPKKRSPLPVLASISENSKQSPNHRFPFSAESFHRRRNLFKIQEEEEVIISRMHCRKATLQG
jgi:hypothetical protein